MHEKSIAIFVNPKRGNSMKHFIDLARDKNFIAEQHCFKDKKFTDEENRVRQLQEFD